MVRTQRTQSDLTSVHKSLYVENTDEMGCQIFGTFRFEYTESVVSLAVCRTQIDLADGKSSGA